MPPFPNTAMSQTGALGFKFLPDAQRFQHGFSCRLKAKTLCQASAFAFRGFRGELRRTQNDRQRAAPAPSRSCGCAARAINDNRSILSAAHEIPFASLRGW